MASISATMLNIIDFDPYTSSFNKLLYEFTPFRIKAFHAHSLLKERSFYLDISFLKVYLKNHSIHFVSMKFMDGFM
jgi:hypothetical protein